MENKKVKVKNMTLKSKPESVLEEFRECFSNINKSVNLKIPNGYIYCVGGMLMKTIGADIYTATKSGWVKI